MTTHDPAALADLVAAAEGDPQMEAYLVGAHAERSAALDCFHEGDLDRAKAHVDAARRGFESVLALWATRPNPRYRAEVFAFGATLLEDDAALLYRRDAPLEEVEALIREALLWYHRLDPGGEAVGRCWADLSQLSSEAGDEARAQEYMRRSLTRSAPDA